VFITEEKETDYGGSDTRLLWKVCLPSVFLMRVLALVAGGVQKRSDRRLGLFLAEISHPVLWPYEYHPAGAQPATRFELSNCAEHIE